MSTKDGQQSLSGESVHPNHLTAQPDHKVGKDLDIDADAGLLYCRDCESRITRNGKGREYGHQRSCDHHEVYAGGSS